jgi:GTPase SAR1 family protein
MNLGIESLSDDQIAKLVGFLKKINYPKEELIFEIKKKLIKPTPATKDVFDDTIKLVDLIRLGFQEIDCNEIIAQISLDVFTLFDRSISRGQVKAIIKRVLGLKLSSTDRSQLYNLRKKIRKSEKFLTYFGEWGKEPDQVFKVIIIGLNDDQSKKLPSLLITPKVSGERKTIGVDFYTKTIEFVDKSLTMLQFWNVSGDKRFEFLREHYYKGASAMIILYEKGNQQSLKLAKKYYSEFKKATNLKFKLRKLKKILIDTPVILVGLGAKPIIPLEGGPILADELGARYLDKKEISADEFEDIFTVVSVELLVKCKYPLQ